MEKVLDPGSTTARRPCQRRDSERTCWAFDIATNLVEAGNKRPKQQGLANCRFQEGDASNLYEVKDQTFDLVVSIFGAMFAPKPFGVAREMVRVTRRGGRITMGDWIPNDPALVAQILNISSAYSSRRDFRKPLLAPLQVGGQLIPADVRSVRGILGGVDRRGLRRQRIADVTQGTVMPFSVSAYPGQTFSGTVARIARAVDVQTRTMAVELDVTNQDGRLSPGTFCQVQWPVRRSAPSLLVPTGSVTSTTGRTFVVRIRDGRAEWVNVNTGLGSGPLVEVFGDLRAVDEVAVRGTDELQPGTEVRVKEVKPAS